MPHVLGLEIPNILPSGNARAAGRLIWFTAIFVIMTVGAIIVMRRPKQSAEPATWAATILGALGVWVWLTLAYAIIPHEWLTFAGKPPLNWGKDTFILRENGLVPFEINREALAHAVVSGMYVGMLVLNVTLFVMWQKRKVAEPATDAADDDGAASATGGPLSRLRRRTSAYGRPVTTSEAT